MIIHIRGTILKVDLLVRPGLAVPANKNSSMMLASNGIVIYYDGIRI